MSQKVTDVLDDAIVPQNNASVQLPNQCNDAQPICPKIGQDCTGTMATVSSQKSAKFRPGISTIL